MKKLFLKLFRDIWETKGQFLSILLVIAIGAFFFAGMSTATSSIGNMINNYYAEQNLADLWGYYNMADQDTVANLKQKNGVKDAEGRYSAMVAFDTKNVSRANGGNDNIKSVKTNLKIQTLTAEINIPNIVDGKLPDNSTKVGDTYQGIIDKKYAGFHNIKVGDTLPIAITITKAMIEAIDPIFGQFMSSDVLELMPKIEIVGLFDSPEYLYRMSDTGLPAAPSALGILQVDRYALTNYMMFAIDENFPDLSQEPTYNEQEVKDFLTGVCSEIVVTTNGSQTIENIFGASFEFTQGNSPEMGAFLYGFARENNVSYSSFKSTFDQISSLVTVFPFIFFFVAAIITFISMSKTVENQRTQIGIMQAIGIKKSQIYWSFILYALFASVVGSLLGGLLGTFFLPMIYKSIFEIQYTMPSMALEPSFLFMFIAIALSVFFAVLSALLSCTKTMREIPAQALRAKPPKKSKPILLEKWKWFWNKISYKSKIIFRNIFLRKTRILLSSIGVIGCIILLIAGIGIKDRVGYVLDNYFYGMNYDLQLSFDSKTPITTENISSVSSEIKEVSLAYNLPVDYKHGEDMQTLFILCVENNSDFVRTKAEGKWGSKIEITENSVIIPHLLASDYGIKVGDEIQVNYSDAMSDRKFLTLTVTNISEQFATDYIYVGTGIIAQPQFEGINANSAFIRLHQSNKSDEVQSQLLDAENLAITSCLSRADMKLIVNDMLSIIDTVVSIIVVGAAALAVTVIYNITSINVFERRREIATLKVLGCYKRELNLLIIAENLVITALGCLLGIIPGFYLFRYIISIVVTMDFTLPNDLTFIVVLISFAVTFVFSLIATMLLNRKMNKIDMIESLKSNE